MIIPPITFDIHFNNAHLYEMKLHREDESQYIHYFIDIVILLSHGNIIQIIRLLLLLPILLLQRSLYRI